MCKKASDFTMKLRLRLSADSILTRMKGLIRSPDALLCTEKVTIGGQKGDNREELKSPAGKVKWESAEES